MMGTNTAKDCTAETLPAKAHLNGKEELKMRWTNLETFTLLELIVTYGTIDEDAKDRFIPKETVKLPVV